MFFGWHFPITCMPHCQSQPLPQSIAATLTASSLSSDSVHLCIFLSCVSSSRFVISYQDPCAYVTTMTVPTPIRPIPTCLCPSRVIRITPEHSNSLASSQRIPDPMHLRPFLSFMSSRFPTTTLIPDPTPFDLLCSCIKSIPDVSSVS